MFSDRAAHRPYGSFADLTRRPVKRIRAYCEMCGCGLAKVKRFCLPCYDIRLEGRKHLKTNKTSFGS
jgi:hypothetical protein